MLSCMIYDRAMHSGEAGGGWLTFHTAHYGLPHVHVRRQDSYEERHVLVLLSRDVVNA